jgi:hypothetical protein
MNRADPQTLRELSIAEWETGRAKRVGDLARALTATTDAAGALPQDGHEARRLVGLAEAHIRIELKLTLNRPNPLRRTQRNGS